jgi:Ni,Fe-hydrogenase I cytochrome b subunit
MKVVSFLSMMSISMLLFAQQENSSSELLSGSSFAQHVKQFSWIYILILVVLLGVFITGYFLGWDKKLFKAKSQDDGPQLFI